MSVFYFTTKTKGRYSLEVSTSYLKKESRGWKWPFGKDELILLKEQVSETSEWTSKPLPQGLRGNSEEKRSLLEQWLWTVTLRERVSTLASIIKKLSHTICDSILLPLTASVPGDVEEPSVLSRRNNSSTWGEWGTLTPVFSLQMTSSQKAWMWRACISDKFEIYMNLDGLMIMGQIFLITRDFLWLNSPWDFSQPRVNTTSRPEKQIWTIKRQTARFTMIFLESCLFNKHLYMHNMNSGDKCYKEVRDSDVGMAFQGGDNKQKSSVSEIVRPGM